MLSTEAIIAALLQELPDLVAIYLFGSRADGSARPESDLDLGILPPRLGGHEFDFARPLALQEKLAACCSCDVDLINLRLAPTVLAKEVITSGKQIYCADRYDADEFEMLTLSFYQKLNEERREVLRTVNDVLLNKKASIERCVSQVRRYYGDAGEIPFAEDHLRQDAISMNLQRLCELSIDMANHLVRTKKLGLPQDSRDGFELLRQAGIISEPMCMVLKSMVGFRNVLVHEYRKLELAIMIRVITERLDDVLDFANVCVAVER